MIYIFSGLIETGKSSTLLNWIDSRTDAYGVLTPRNKQGNRYILNVKTKNKSPFQAKPSDAETISVGRYHFFKSAFETANSIIKNATNEEENGFIVIDELGKLELRSEGLHPSAQLVINKTRSHKTLHSILVIRHSLLNDIKNKYKITNSIVFNTPKQLMLKA
jgi:nucleoside-triphosphatase THEP1